MGGYLNKIGLHGHPLDTDVRVLKEPRTVPYNRMDRWSVSVPYPYRIGPYLVARSWRDFVDDYLHLQATLSWGGEIPLTV